MKKLFSNCSEVIFRLDIKNIKEAKESLKEVGIQEVTIENWYDWHEDPEEARLKMLMDSDNPNLPDFENHATLELRDTDNGYGVEGVYIEGDQHCQSQLFKTMKKIEDKFSGEWESQDGGSTYNYKEWKEEGCKEVDNYNIKHKDKRNELFNLVPKQNKMDLKTLKDLDQFAWVIDTKGFDFKKLKATIKLDAKDIGSVKVYDLKQEAIKWIKSGFKQLSEEDNKEDRMLIRGGIESFKHFFNIQNSDLKNEI